jgi:hypothetical protein
MTARFITEGLLQKLAQDVALFSHAIRTPSN